MMFLSVESIKGSMRPMGPIPYMPLIYVWDRSHVLLKDPYGTSIYRDSLRNVWDLSKETFFC